MYTEESLMPPSAFLDTFKPNRISNNDNRFYNIGFENSTFNNHDKGFTNLINNSTQTNVMKTLSKASMTNDSIITCEQMDEKIKLKKAKFIDKINSINQGHQAKCTELNEVITNLTRQLSESNKEKCSYHEELKTMKFYISGIENYDVWLKEKQRLMGEIEEFKINKHEQQSTIDSLKIQLSNMEKIQSIQERELEGDIIKSSSHKLLSHEIRFESLLRAWRHKVLSLLVQQQSDDVCVKKEKHQMKLVIQDLQNEIEHMQNHLETMSLKLKSNEVELSLKDTTIEKLRREIALTLKEIETMKQTEQTNNLNLDLIFSRLEQFQNYSEKEFEIKLLKVTSKLDVLQRRMEYANSRFPMIQAGIVRSRNVTGRSDTSGTTNPDMSVEGTGCLIYELEQALLISNKEIEQLKSERDQLIVIVEKDSVTFQERINEKKQSLDDEMAKLHSTVRHLEKSLSQTTRELDIVKEENMRIKSSHDQLLTDKYNEMENLQASLNQSQNDFSTLSLEFSEFKRVSAKYRNRHEEEIQRYRQNLAECEHFWSSKCDQLTAECNLLKITIRQDGILSKLKTRTKDNNTAREQNKPYSQNFEMRSVMKEVENLTNELQIGANDCDT